MKISKKFLLISSIFIIFFIFLGLLLIGYNSEDKLKYSKEYLIGEKGIKGEVDIDYFKNIDESLEIGANSYGYAVFKNPHNAFTYLEENYVDGINLIKKEFDLEELSESYYELYGVYGSQVTGGNDKEIAEAKFISEFFDIYENSFKKR